MPPCFHVLYKVHEFHPSESRSSRYVIFYWSILLAVLKDGSSSYFTIEKACDSQILHADHGKTLPPTLELWMQKRNQVEASAVTGFTYSIQVYNMLIYIYICVCINIYICMFFKHTYIPVLKNIIFVNTHLISMWLFDPSAYTELTCRSMVSGSRFDSGFSAGSLDQVSMETPEYSGCCDSRWCFWAICVEFDWFNVKESTEVKHTSSLGCGMYNIT